MNAPKVDEVDYIQFLIAAPKAFTCCEAARSHSCDLRCQSELIAYDSFVRLLSRQPTDTAALWQEVEPLVNKTKGCLVIDDSTLDKPYGRQIALVTRYWSGKYQSVVRGINRKLAPSGVTSLREQATRPALPPPQFILLLPL